MILVSREARGVFLEKYVVLHSRQIGRTSGFAISINFEKDLLYLNRRFVRNPNCLIVSSLNEASIIYPDWLAHVKQLGLKLTDTNPLAQGAWNLIMSPGSQRPDLWKLLGEKCPQLRLLSIVDDELEWFRKCDLTKGDIVQPNRDWLWNSRWELLSLGLKNAKINRIVR
ncbi:hypothetical protein WAI453_008189 [Rhynchosporium graminicola]